MKKLLGQLLIEKEYITEENLKDALSQQSSTGKRLGQILLDEGFITSEQMVDAMKEQGYKRVNVMKSEPNFVLIKDMDENYLRKNIILPYSLDGQVLEVVTQDPLNYQVLDFMEKHFGALKVVPLLGTESEIVGMIDKVFGGTTTELEDKIDEEDTEELLEEELEEGPLVKFIDEILHRAVEQKASDIHIEPQQKKNTRVRFRIDGELHKHTDVSRAWHKQIVSRIKIMAKLDISKKLEPQDGQASIAHGKGKVDLRVSTLPTVAGEKVVLRIMDKTAAVFDIDNIGLSERHYSMINKALHKKQGIILVTGPTGSGKTTTLYSMLDQLNNPGLNISTIEDPVELPINGINQVQVTKKIKFSNALRSLLRQDPDVIMVGEIRDLETARTAINSSLTGHLFLSTLHTNDSIGVVSRMINMGVEPYLLADALKIIISQRLVRKICPNCRREDPEGLKLAKKMFPEQMQDVDMIYKGDGCVYCSNVGKLGRTGIYEMFIPDEEIMSLISSNKVQEIRASGKVDGIILDALEKLKQGVIDFEEVLERANI